MDKENIEQNQNEKTPAEERQEKQEKLKKQLNRSERRVKEYQTFILRALLLALFIWVLFFKVIGFMTAPNDDMVPRVDGGDLLLFYRLDTDVSAQDVIVFEKKDPKSGKQDIFIGRVVAKSGETVDISDGSHLMINDHPVVEPKIYFSTPKYEDQIEYPVKLEKNQCFVLSDSRIGGTDSRYFGPVEKDEILGTVITLIRRNNL